MEEDFSQGVAAMMQEIIDSGGGMPILLVCVGKNGSMLYHRYQVNDQGDIDCELLAETMAPEGLMLPINMMFVDAQGEAYRAIVRKNERPKLMH
jgi:hypothetical protein